MPWHDRAMSDPQRSGEASRRDTAAQRRAEREASMDAGAVAPHSVNPIPKRTLFLAGAGALAILGMVTSVLSPAAALVFFVPAVALAGYAWKLPGVDRLGPRSLATDALTRAYEDARRAVDQSPRLESDRRVELLAVIDGGFEQVRNWEASRSELERAGAELAGSDAPEAARVRSALSDLEARKAAFIQQCDSLRRTVTALDLQGQPGGDSSELQDATDLLKAEVAADTELTEALRAARAPVGHEPA
jgi:hypothetical protein